MGQQDLGNRSIEETLPQRDHLRLTESRKRLPCRHRRARCRLPGNQRATGGNCAGGNEHHLTPVGDACGNELRKRQGMA